MNTPVKPALLGGPGTIEDNVQSLSRALFRGDIQESQIREIPPQNLYFAIKHVGLDSSPEILDAITYKQYGALLDFELWTKDSFREDRLWDWIAAIDDPKNLIPLQRFLQVLDPDILSLLVKRYVEVIYHEERDDRPPGPNFYSPDQGATWISFKTQDPDRHRMMGKLLAFIFQTNQDAYYQLLLHAHQATTFEFEEEAYRERSRRLLNEFIPPPEEAAEGNTSVNIHTVKDQIRLIAEKQGTALEIAPDYPLIPLFNRGIPFQPLISILEQLSEERLYEIQSELSRILNGAVVFFVGDFAEEISLRLTSEQVFGVINIGFQLLIEDDPDSIRAEILNQLPITLVYKLGLHELYRVRKIAQKIPEDIFNTLEHMNEPLASIIQSLRRPLPNIPEFFREDGTFDIREESMSTDLKAISSLQEVRTIEKLLDTQVIQKYSEIRSYEKQSSKHIAIKEGATKNMQ